jgi:ubiquinone/menaquinone biosynthesis C-methylase UbiE
LKKIYKKIRTGMFQITNGNQLFAVIQFSKISPVRGRAILTWCPAGVKDFVEAFFIVKYIVSNIEKIQAGYRRAAARYDDYITSRKLWSKILARIMWGMTDEQYAAGLLAALPADFQGKLLDVPAGTAVFTREKYSRWKNADITCLDYSPEMLALAKAKFSAVKNGHVKFQRGDAGDLPFADGVFDIVLSMNGLHAFPDKEKALAEMWRVLKKNGLFLGCFYIKGERKLTDFFIQKLFVPGGVFTPPFLDKTAAENKLKENYRGGKFWQVNSIFCFRCYKK